MAKATPPQREERVSMSSMLALASWRLRSSGFLLLIIAFGIVVAVVVASTIPLFSNAMITAGIHSVLRASPYNTELTLDTATQAVSTKVANAVHDQFDPLFHNSVGNSVHLEQSALLSEDCSLPPSSQPTSTILYGTPMDQAAPHLHILQGRLAHTMKPSATDIEMVMTSASAKRLGLHVGSTFPLVFQYFGVSNKVQERITAHLVGIFEVTPSNAAYWHDNDFDPFALLSEATATVYQYTLLVPYDALLALYDHVAPLSRTDSTISSSYEGVTLLWYYRLDASQVTVSNLDNVISRFAALRATTTDVYGSLEYGENLNSAVFPYLIRANITTVLLSSDTSPSILELFRSRIDVARIPIGVFGLLSIALILFFVSLMTSVLIDRQTDTLALLRSRGASRGQIFWTLFIQGAILGIIALVIGLPLAVVTTFLLARRALPDSSLDALNVLAHNPFLAMLGVIWYALAVMLAALLTMSISLFIVARMDILSLRRTAARATRQPLWQRLNLDIIAGVIALVAYAFSLYVTSVGNVLSSDAQVLLATPLTVVAPFFLILGFLFLFLRLFPLLLRGGAYLAARGRSAVSLLAFAQIARSPRQSLRLTTLLALAVSFTLFALVYNATEVQHIQEIVNYETGADFSINLNNAGATLAQVLHQYQSIHGVRIASAGHVDQARGGGADMTMSVSEVDPVSFGNTVIWPSPQEYQHARPLLSQLVALRPTIVTDNEPVPAIVDQPTLDTLRLHIGSTFTTILNDSSQAIYCQIIGAVNYIPTTKDRVVTGPSSDSTQGAVLIDYQTYTHFLVLKAQAVNGHVVPISPPSVDHAWLRTNDDAASIASVQIALNSPQYKITQLVDRRLLLASLQSDPLYVILIGVLGLGTIATLLLALIGDLLTSWLSASTRVTSFALLRALGITSRQVATMLTWEQAIVYGTGIMLGSGFGTLLIVSVIPAITFTNLNSNLSNQQFFALQSALSTQIVVPPLLPFVLLILVAIYAIALTIMIRVTTQSTLSQALRLNED